MPVRKYYCDYCEKQFADTPADRKRHNSGIQHKQAKDRWYNSFKTQQNHQNSLPIPPPSNQQPICYHFLNKGFCGYGDSCRYFHPNSQQQQPITNAPGNVVGDSVGVLFDNLPPSLQPPPEGGYPNFPFVDWG